MRQGALIREQTFTNRPHPDCATTRTPIPGMYLGGAATFVSFATGTILVVAISVVGSLTVLPAMLLLLLVARLAEPGPPASTSGTSASSTSTTRPSRAG